MNIKLSIIIPTFNRADDLRLCLESIFRQDFDPVDYQVIVVDNGPSSDSTREVVNAFSNSNLIYIETSQKGMVYAYRRGIVEAKGKVFLFLDDDVELLDKDTLLQVFGVFEKNQEVGVLSGLDKKDANNFQKEARNVGSITSQGVVTTNFAGINKFPNYQMEIDHSRGCFLAVRAQAYFVTDGFDTTYDDITSFMAFRNETDLCFKIKQSGYKIILDRNIVFLHKASVRPKEFQARDRSLRHFYFVYKAHSLFVLKNLKINKFFWVIFQIFIGDFRVPGLFYIIRRRLNPLIFFVLLYSIAIIFIFMIMDHKNK